MYFRSRSLPAVWILWMLVLNNIGMRALRCVIVVEQVLFKVQKKFIKRICRLFVF